MTKKKEAEKAIVQLSGAPDRKRHGVISGDRENLKRLGSKSESAGKKPTTQEAGS